VDLYASVLEEGHEVELADLGQRRIFVQVVSGDLEVNGERLGAGDGLQLRHQESVTARARSEAEFLLFSLA
jgi:redox-sensitive bicupin YhaK (pirin superfamily)